MSLSYKIQFFLITLYLFIQTLTLRFIYLSYGRSSYKTFSYLGFALLISTILFLIAKNKWTWKDMGIRTDNLKKKVLPYVFVTLIFGISIFVLNRLLDRPLLPSTRQLSHFYRLFLLSSWGQEFVFRGFLMRLQGEVFKDKKYLMLTNAFLFGFMHIMVITEPILFSFTTTFLLGLAWAYLYEKNPNLIQVTLSHAVLNFLVTFLGFFSFRA